MHRVAASWQVETEELPAFESPSYAMRLAEAGVSVGQDVFAGFVAALGPRGVRDEEDRPVHRLLGYADPLQADVYGSTEGNAEQVPFDAWNTIDHARAAAGWRLLLQVDSDPGRDVLFGDGGVLAFMIRAEDLAARHFDRVWVEWQSH